MARPIHFNGWRLDPNSGELIRGAQKVRLQEQPLQILQALLANPGQVVTRDELVNRLWPKGIVDFETGLNTAMRRLRAALGEDADSPRYIETLPRRGYRFIGTLDDAAVSGQDHELLTLLTGAGDSASRRMDCLVLIQAPAQQDAGRRFALDKDTTTIGRGLENDIVLASQSVSRRHSRIEFRDEQAFVVDGASTNGTFINDDARPVRDGRLNVGDILRVGDRAFAYLGGRDLETQYQELILRIAMTDSSSGAASRKHLDHLLADEIERARRHDRPLAILMIGVDLTRERHGEFGELISDATLRSFATTLHKRLRPQDRLARYGDREFCVVMPETALAGALKIAEELPALVVGATASGASPLTIKTGAASLEENMQLADMYRLAEQALNAVRTSS